MCVSLGAAFALPSVREKTVGLMAVVANVVLVKHRTSVFPESVSAYLTVLGRCAVPMGAEECAVIVGQKKSAWKEPAKR